MDILEKLRELLGYYGSCRAVGHTYTMIHGVKNNDQKVVVMGYTKEHARIVSEGCDNVILASWQSPNRLRGLRYPIAIDNYAMWHILMDAQKEIELLRNRLSVLEPQENLTPTEAAQLRVNSDSAKGCAEYEYCECGHCSKICQCA